MTMCSADVCSEDVCESVHHGRVCMYVVMRGCMILCICMCTF